MDFNFVAVCNALLKMANPDYTLKNYVEPGDSEPAAPAEDDCYLVIEAGTVWGETAEVNDILRWDGSAWEVLPVKITELNALFQGLFFEAANIAVAPPYGMTAVDVQAAIDELAAAVFGEASGSGSGG